MSEVKRYDMRVSLGGIESYESPCGDYVDYDDYAALEAKCAELAAELKQIRIDADCYKNGMEASNARLVQLAAENAELKSSREILAKNTLEACNAIASAGFSHEAIMRGLYASTGNGNKYPKPITTLVDEALRDFQTPATDAFLAEVRAQGVDMAMEHMQSSGSLTFGDCYISLNEFAAGLRKGGEQK